MSQNVGQDLVDHGLGVTP